MKKKALVITLSSIVAAGVFCVGWLALCGYLWTWGPFSSLADVRFGNLPGNGEEYALENVEVLEEKTPLHGRRIAYLGSSVTKGASSLSTSFVEYIAKRNEGTYVKEAVSGTTLVEEGIDSYVSRLSNIAKDETLDLFVVQLSTNDATQNKNLGRVDPEQKDGYDTHTVAGAIEHIIDYVNETYGCPIVFYTNAHYESEAYSRMVDLIHEIRDKHAIHVADMYSDESFNDISEDERNLYMADAIHPTKAGYLEWWTPFLESEFVKALS